MSPATGKFQINPIMVKTSERALFGMITPDGKVRITLGEKRRSSRSAPQEPGDGVASIVLKYQDAADFISGLAAKMLAIAPKPCKKRSRKS